MSHGGSRPLNGSDDGRLTPNCIVEPASPGHHHVTPGAWMPHAGVRVDEQPIIWIGCPTTINLSAAADEDLMPWERKIKQSILGS